MVTNRKIRGRWLGYRDTRCAAACCWTYFCPWLPW